MCGCRRGVGDSLFYMEKSEAKKRSNFRVLRVDGNHQNSACYYSKTGCQFPAHQSWGPPESSTGTCAMYSDPPLQASSYRLLSGTPGTGAAQDRSSPSLSTCRSYSSGRHSQRPPCPSVGSVLDSTLLWTILSGPSKPFNAAPPRINSHSSHLSLCLCTCDHCIHLGSKEELASTVYYYTGDGREPDEIIHGDP